MVALVKQLILLKKSSSVRVQVLADLESTMDKWSVFGMFSALELCP